MSYQAANYAGYPPQLPAAPHQPFPPPPPQQLQQGPPPLAFPYHAQQPSSRPTPPPSFRLSKTSIHNLQTNQLILTITRKSAYGIPSGLGLSSKSLIEIINPFTQETIGTLKFHDKTSNSSSIDITLRRSSSKLKNEGLLGRDKWAFQRIVGPEKWYWIMESGSRGVLQDQKKDGQVIAKLDDGWLVIEKLGLSDMEFEEVFVTSVAVMEKARRSKKDSEEAEAVGEVISALAGA